MQAVQIEMFPKSREEQEQEVFLSVLHHDAMKRGGFFARLDLRKENGENRNKTKWASKKSYSLMTTDDSYNRYITLNSFHNIEEECSIFIDGQEQKVLQATLKRDTNHLHAISTVYLDLDFHDGTMQEIQERVRNTKELLNHAYKNGILPRPTMVTETGRGLGVFYVLDKTIANVKGAQKQINFWKYICTEFANKYKDLLSESDKPQLEIDFKVVGEKTRVVRLPGTYNLKTRTICRLISLAKKEDGTPLYYTLNDLIQYVENYKVYTKPYEDIKKKEIRKKVINFRTYTKPYLVARLSKLQKAQNLVRDQKEGCRELLCFFYYNTAVQLMDSEEAVKSMLEFNSQFTYPITDSRELGNIISSVSKAKDMDGNVRGYYEFSDAKILEKLGLSEAQNEHVGFCSSMKELERKQKKEENQKRKQERNESIIKYVIEHPDETYEEIAGLFEVSVRTVKGILKAENIHRYQIQEREVSICDAEETSEDNIINIEEYVKATPKKGAVATPKSKVQKNAPVSISVVHPYIYNNTIRVNNTPTPINTAINNRGTIPYKKGDNAYTDKELKRIREMDLLEEDGWVYGDYSWVFE